MVSSSSTHSFPLANALKQNSMNLHSLVSFRRFPCTSAHCVLTGVDGSAEKASKSMAMILLRCKEYLMSTSCMRA